MFKDLLASLGLGGDPPAEQAATSEAIPQPAPSRPTLFSYIINDKHASGFSSASTVAQVVRRCGVPPGYTALVTGATSPIATALCNELCAHGATVIMGHSARSSAACAALAAELTDVHSAVGGCAHAVLVDLSSLAAAQAAAAQVLALGLPLHAIIHCAATAVPECRLSPDGFESQFAVNYLNPLLLTLLLLPHLGDSGGSAGHSGDAAQQRAVIRVVWCACSAHQIAYTSPSSSSGQRFAWRVSGEDAAATFMPAQAFGQSKLACVMGAAAVAARAAGAGLQVAAFAAHPGVTEAGLRSYAGASPDSWTHGIKSLFATGLASAGLLKTPEQAAATLAYAALAPELLQAEFLSGADGSCWGGQVQGPHGATCWWSYLEDCSPSVPSARARDPEDTAMLGQVTEGALLAFLGPGHDCQLLPQPPEPVWADAPAEVTPAPEPGEGTGASAAATLPVSQHTL